MSDLNIILIGMPAAGKSTLGLLLAKRLAKQFVDTDILIQTREGRTLQQIVDEDGYEALRAIEADVLSTMDVSGHVVATGGSAIYSEAAMAALKRHGRCVYLQVPLAEISKRIGDVGQRGLARPPGQDLAALYAEREPLYLRFADHCIGVGSASPESVVDNIIQALD